MRKMRKIMIAAVMLVSLAAFAQRGEEPSRREMAKNLTSEEIATLQTKKITLALALDDAQAKKVYPLMLGQAQDRKQLQEARNDREKGTKLTEEQRYEMTNKRLDKQIAMQNQMKKILTEEQFEKFTKMNHRRGGKEKRGKGKYSNRKS